MKPSRRASLALSLAIALSACGNTKEPSPTSSTGSLAVSTEQAAHKMKRGHGPLRMLERALATLELTADQRATINELITAAQTRHAPMLAARRDLLQAVAAQVEDGRINRVALQPKIDALKAAFKTAMPADRAAVEQLHGILDAKQRAALVDSLQAHKKNWLGRHHEGGRHLGRIFSELNLTDEQQQQVRESMQALRPAHKSGQHRAMKAGHAQLLEAFKGDTFTMPELPPAPDGVDRGGPMADRVTKMAETLLPVLTPAQRTTLAATIRARAERLAAK
jgi:Spy/CpxP family protein refolding chaperone